MTSNDDNKSKGKITEKKKVFSLKVLEAYNRDVARGVARIDYDSMDSLGVSTGDVIEIKGKRRTVAKCLPLYPSDEGKAIIRFDGLIRANAGIEIGDLASLQKVKAFAAEKVIVAPLEAIPPVDSRYLADALETVPLIKGDQVMIPYFGGRLSFQIKELVPAVDVVIVTQKTTFTIGKTLRTPEEEKLDEMIEKINSKIQENEKLLAEMINATTLDESKISAIFKTISKLEEIKSYFSKKIKY